MSKQDGGPAFPGNEDWMHSGLSLRDYFAGQALAICAEPGYIPDTLHSGIAAQAYEIADAMLAERDKP